MRKSYFVWALAVTIGMASMTPLSAQSPAAAPAVLPDVSPQFVVAYIEVKPDLAEKAAGLIRTQVSNSRTEAGAIEFSAFRRIGYPYHFALIEQWKGTAAFNAHNASEKTKLFRTALEPTLVAPYDERRHHTLNVGTKQAVARDTIAAITHVDIIPTDREAGIESVRALGDKIRGTNGSYRYDVLTQSSRPNHMTLVEVWKDQAAYRSHIASNAIVDFRKALGPRSGSLYDERLYRAL